jgi:nucleoside-diphosphate-sugar epimerase
MIIRPLFAYGGIGDMNSLMAKSFFAIKDKRDSLDMFLDPYKTKDYLHVSDFCNAVALSCVKGLFGDDYNVSASTPCVTGEIVDTMSQVSGFDLSEIIRWHPKTDYLGNHILSSEKFRRKSGWKPQLTLREGLESSWHDIMYKSSSNYNPLVYLDVARKIGIDLTQFY